MVFDNTTTGFLVSSTCGCDQGAQDLVASTRSVQFRRIGPVSCIEVVGIPAFRCRNCDEQAYDLTLLAHIESVLYKRVGQGLVQTRYTFEQLASDLTADMPPGKAI